MGFLKSALGSSLGSAVGVAGNLIGGAMSDSRTSKASYESWLQNYNAQKEFAQNSILWRVQDAKRAGVNPNAVVGGQSVGYTPQDISQTQDFATGIARAGNILAERMGQLQLANANEDLKSKKLDNQVKGVELANKVIESKMGQLPKTMTPIIEGSAGGELQNFSDRSGIFSKQSSGLDEPFGIAREALGRFDRKAHEAIANTNRRHLGLGLGGYYDIEPGKLSFHDRAMLDASNHAGKTNSTAKGVFKLIDNYIQSALDNIIKPIGRHAVRAFFLP